MDTVVIRSIAGAGLALSLGIGVWTASRLTLDTAAVVETTMARRISPEQAQRQALEHKASYADSEVVYQGHIDDAVRDHELSAPDLERLRAPNPYVQVVSPSDPRVVASGGQLREAGFEVRIRSQAIEIERRGILTKPIHTLAEIENVGDKPIAYFLDLHVRDGGCQIRALTRYNAMALQPGEKGEISVCAGTHDVEVRDLRIMEVTEIGAHWISKVPALAVGYDAVIARSHFGGSGVAVCAEIPATDFANRIADGEVEWQDIIDFYSRHDCEHYRWPSDYRRATAPLERLP